MTNGILFSEMEPDRDWEGEFHDWYDREHVPARLALSGFTTANRYVRVGAGTKFGVVYAMSDMDVLHTPAYNALKKEPSPLTAKMLSSVKGFTRYIAHEISAQARPDAPERYLDAPYLYVVQFQVPAEREDAFNTWYETDHVPLLLKHPRWLGVRRYKVQEGEPGAWTHLALHYLGGLDTMQSPEREAARNTPMRDALANEPWFKPQYKVFRRLAQAW